MRSAVNTLSVLLLTSLRLLGGTPNYSYDALNRLTKVAYADGTTIVYAYDSAGNRLSRIISNPSISLPKVSVDKSTLTLSTAAGQTAQAQTITVTNGGGGNLQWVASTTASWLSVTPGSGTNSGTVTVTASAAGMPAGTYNANIRILASASNAPLSIPVIFTVTGAQGNPLVSSGGIVSAARSSPGIARGSVASIYGSALADLPASATTVPLPLALVNVQVSVNGLKAPLWYVGPGQINFQVPFEAPLQGQASVIVSRDGVASAPSTVTLTPYAPSIFMYQRTASALDPIIVHAASNQLVTPGSPAVAGEYLTVYGTGIGDLNVLPVTGALSPENPVATSTVTPTATIGRVNAPVTFAGLTPDAVGLAQFNLEVPQGLPAGVTLPLVISYGTVASQTVQLYVVSTSAPGQTSTTTTLASSANPSTFGTNLTLMATVSPSAATGSVTFYDGAAVLGTSAITGGRAALTTTLLPFGTRSLKAYYQGGAGYAPSTSLMVAQVVQSLPGSGFASAVSYGAGSQPWSIAVGDFNGDGRDDLAVSFVGSGVEVLLGNGDGTFKGPVTYRAGIAPQSVVAGDFNGDGKTDLAVANANCGLGNGTVSVLLGNGDGTFQSAVNYPGTASCLVWLAVGDFNGDGKIDVAAVNQAGTLDLFMGNGDGTLEAAVGYSVGASSNSVAVGDFNLDGSADLAICTNAGVSVLMGNGDATFSAPVIWGSGCGALTVSDLNGDGKPDLAVANNGISILLGNGDGTFRTAVSYLAGVSPQGNIAIGDFNGDGRADLAVASSFANTVGILLGNGDGTFQAETTYAVGSYPAFIAVGSFRGNGVTDLAVANESNSNLSGGNVSVLIGIPAIGSGGDTVLSVTGPPVNNGTGIFPTNPLAFSFTVGQSYSNVTISADLVGTFSGTAYLMSQIGVGTTTANQIATGPFTSAGAPFGTMQTVLQNVSLVPGTYFLVLSTSQSILPQGLQETNSPVIVSDVGASTNGMVWYSSSPAAYVPASAFGIANGGGGAYAPEFTVVAGSNGAR